MKHFPAPTEAEDSASRLVIGGEQVDLRTREARRFKTILRDLCNQLGTDPTPAERLQLSAAATLSLLIERDTLKMIRGELTEEEPLRRNVQALRAALTSLGLAQKSRDVKKSDLKRGGSILLGIAQPHTAG